MATSTWGSSGSAALLAKLHKEAPPQSASTAPTLVTKISQLASSIRADSTVYSVYMNMEPEKGKSTKLIVASPKAYEAHDGENRIRYYCPEDGAPSIYPHITVKAGTDGTLINLHLSIQKNVAVWYEISTGRLSGTTGFWNLSQGRRGGEAAHFITFLTNAYLTGSVAPAF